MAANSRQKNHLHNKPRNTLKHRPAAHRNSSQAWMSTDRTKGLARGAGAGVATDSSSIHDRSVTISRRRYDEIWGIDCFGLRTHFGRRCR
jgi:hypothetical protein